MVAQSNGLLALSGQVMVELYMPNLDYEIRYGRDAGKIICGVDEVGRGPLAGPVMAAAVILPPDLPLEMRDKIRDSKKMSYKQREALYEPLKRLCQHSIAQASVEEIQALNVLWASMLAMQRAVSGLKTKIDMALIDGNRVPKLECPAAAIVKGDDKSLSISAASILAKVTRDRLMSQLAIDHPHYGWERNAGYGTPQHLQGLQQYGVTPWHRMDFAPIAKLKNK